MVWHLPRLALLLLAVQLHLRRHGLASTLARYPGRLKGRLSLAPAVAAARWLRRFSSLRPSARCLERAITLRYWLAQKGFESHLKIGTQRGARGFAAHAWVEVAGVPVLEASTVRADFSAFLGPDL